MITSDQLGRAVGVAVGSPEPSTDGAHDVCTFRRDGGESVVVTVFGGDGLAALDEAERSPDRVQIALPGTYAIATGSTLWLRSDDVVVRIAVGDKATMSALNSVARGAVLPTDEPTGSSDHASEAGSCELLRPEEVEEIVGGSVSVKPMSKDYLGQFGAVFAEGCQYLADEVVNLFVYGEGRAEQAIADVEGQAGDGELTATTLADVGDKAVSYRRGTDPASYVVVQRGDRGIWLQVTASEEQTVELARRAVDRL